MNIELKTMPLSVNRLYTTARGRRILTGTGRVNKEALAWEARTQYRGLPLKGDLSVSVDVYWPTKRNHDIDNPVKSLLDSMSGILYEDDQQITELHLKKSYDKANPRVELSCHILPPSEALPLEHEPPRHVKGSKAEARRLAALG